MGDRTELIKVRVTPDQHEEIKDYLDETEEWGSLSTFGQHVLVDYVRNGGDDGDESRDEPVSIDTSDIMDAVEMGMSPINERLEQIERNMREMHEILHNDPEVRELADQLYENLIEVPDGQTIEDLSPIHPDDAFLIGTPEALGNEFGEDAGTIRRGLDLAEKLYPDIEYIVDDHGERRYYRSE